MEIKGVQFEDFVNYKKPCTTVLFPYCNFKCELENCGASCHNSPLAQAPTITVPATAIIEEFLHNNIVDAICFQGLEPFDSFEDMFHLIELLRDVYFYEGDIVIYTGFYPQEIEEKLTKLKKYSKIIIKFGRFIPNSNSKYDKLLGVTLASDNQYSKRIEDL